MKYFLLLFRLVSGLSLLILNQMIFIIMLIFKGVFINFKTANHNALFPNSM